MVKMIQEQFNVELLQENSIRTFFAQRTDKELVEEFHGDVDEFYSYLKTNMQKITKEVLGSKTKTRKNSWSEEIQRVVQGKKKKKKKSEFTKWLQKKNEDGREYKKKRIV